METMMEETKVSPEETIYRSKYFRDIEAVEKRDLVCASCGNTLNQDAKNAHSHPVLGVLQCQPCFDQFRLLRTNTEKNKLKKNCLICASSNVSKLYTCTGRNCNFSFCKKCIKRNAANALLVVYRDNWRCFVCNTKPLWQSRGVCAAMMASRSRRSRKKKKERDFPSDSDASSEDIKKQRKQQTGRNSRAVTKASQSAKPNKFQNNFDENSDDDDDVVATKIIQHTSRTPTKSRTINNKTTLKLDNRSSQRKAISDDDDDDDDDEEDDYILETKVIQRGRLLSPKSRTPNKKKQVQSSDNRDFQQKTSSDEDESIQETKIVTRGRILPSRSRRINKKQVELPDQDDSQRKNSSDEDDDSVHETKLTRRKMPGPKSQKMNKKKQVELSDHGNSRRKVNKNDDDDNGDGDNSIQESGVVTRGKTQSPKSRKDDEKKQIESKDDRKSQGRSSSSSVEIVEKKSTVKPKTLKSQAISRQGIEKAPVNLGSQNSDSSSGKEFANSKLLKESYVPLQKLDHIVENSLQSENINPSDNNLTKTQALNLKTNCEQFITDLKMMITNIQSAIESTKKLYCTGGTIKPIDASKSVVESKNILCALKKRIENNEKKLLTRHDNWCKKSRLKNIFASSSNSENMMKRESRLRRKKKTSESSLLEEGVSSPEREIDIKKPVVSECDSDEIFSADESRSAIKESNSSSLKKLEKSKAKKVESSGIETEGSNPDNSDARTGSFSPQPSTSLNEGNQRAHSSKDSSSSNEKSKKHDESLEDIFHDEEENLPSPVKTTDQSNGKKSRKTVNSSKSSSSDEEVIGTGEKSKEKLVENSNSDEEDHPLKSSKKSKRLISKQISDESEEENLIETSVDSSKKLSEGVSSEVSISGITNIENAAKKKLLEDSESSDLEKSTKSSKITDESGELKAKAISDAEKSTDVEEMAKNRILESSDGETTEPDVSNKSKNHNLSSPAVSDDEKNDDTPARTVKRKRPSSPEYPEIENIETTQNNYSKSKKLSSKKYISDSSEYEEFEPVKTNGEEIEEFSPKNVVDNQDELEDATRKKLLEDSKSSGEDDEEEAPPRPSSSMLRSKRVLSFSLSRSGSGSDSENSFKHVNKKSRLGSVTSNTSKHNEILGRKTSESSKSSKKLSPIIVSDISDNDEPQKNVEKSSDSELGNKEQNRQMDISNKQNEDVEEKNSGDEETSQKLSAIEGETSMNETSEDLEKSIINENIDSSDVDNAEEIVKKKLLASSSESEREKLNQDETNSSDSSSKGKKKSGRKLTSAENEKSQVSSINGSSDLSDADAEEIAKRKLLATSSDSEPEKSKQNEINSSEERDEKDQENSQDKETSDLSDNNDAEENAKRKLLAEASEFEQEKSNQDENGLLGKKGKDKKLKSQEEKASSKLDKKQKNPADEKSKVFSSSENSDVLDPDIAEKNARKKMLASSSDSEQEKQNPSETDSLGDKSRDEQNNSEDRKSSLKSGKGKKKKFNPRRNRYYEQDRKLRMECQVKIKRLPRSELRKHAKALKKSREYLENKKIKSLVSLDPLERNRSNKGDNNDDDDGDDDDNDDDNSSSSDDCSSSSRNRQKKTAKDSEETLMDHLKNLKNGDTMDVDDASSSDSEKPTSSKNPEDLELDIAAEAEKLAQEKLLEPSDSEADDENNQDPDNSESENSKAEKKKKSAMPSKTTENSDGKGSGSEKDNSTETPEKKKDDGKGNWRRNKLLTMTTTSSDSDEQDKKTEKKMNKLKSSQELGSEVESDDKSPKRKKKRIRRLRLDSDSDVIISDPSSNSDNDSEENEKEEKKSGKNDGEKIKNKRARRKKKNDSSSDTSTGKSRPKTKRRRIKTENTDSDSSVEELNNSQGTPGKSGRKNIRKVLKDTKVADDTKQAAKQEEERLKRMAERQRIYNEMYEVRLAGEEKVDELVLDFDEESKEELLSVDKNLVKKLKPHQARGIKFMWDACFESLERAKTTKGSGCILAHCMGLGKSFQVVTLAHTLLTNSENTKVKTVLVVCPLSTVLNWVNEFKIWLKEVNNEDEIEVYEMTKMKKHFERKYQLESWQKTGGVMILGYEMFRNLSNPLKKVAKKIRESFTKCLVDPGPDLVVCDEGHLLKSESTAISKAMSKIRTLRRIVLTGTPLQNNLVEYHCMVQFVKPNLLGTRKEFLNRFVNPISNGQFDDSTEYDVKIMKKRAHVLHKMLEGSVQRFDYSVLTPFLPPKQEYVIFVKLTEVQTKLYQYYIDNLARKHRGAGGSLFADFQALQRVWTHPISIKTHAEKIAGQRMHALDTDSEGSLKDFIDDDESENSSSSVNSVSSKSGSDKESSKIQGRLGKSTRANPIPDEPVEEVAADHSEWWHQFVGDEHLEDMRISTKLMLLFDILKESENIGDKVLVFSQSLYSLNLIEHFLAILDEETQKGVTSDFLNGHTGNWALGLDYFRLDGQTSTENRSLWCKSFNRPTNTRARLFLISTRAGGLGINLTAANRVIIFDASWNPSHDVQSIFRIYRFGQKKPCYVYRLLAAGTMEEKIYNRQVTKLSLSCRVVDEQQIERHYSNNDLAELYKLEPTEEKTTNLALPKDRLLAEIFLRHENIVRNYHEHDSLLENKAEEELDEEERKQAWLEYEEEKSGRRQMGMPLVNYQDQLLMQQYNNQLLNQQMAMNGASMQQEFESLQAMILKDYPNISDAARAQMASKSMIDMYTYLENQAVLNNLNNPMQGLRPQMQSPLQMALQQQQQQKYQHPSNTLANALAGQEYARHHMSSKQMTAQQKQIQYAQQFGNFRTVPTVPPQVPAQVGPPPLTQMRSTNPIEPEVVEVLDSSPPPPSTSNPQRGKNQEE